MARSVDFTRRSAAWLPPPPPSSALKDIPAMRPLCPQIQSKDRPQQASDSGQSREVPDEDHCRSISDLQDHLLGGLISGVCIQSLLHLAKPCSEPRSSPATQRVIHHGHHEAHHTSQCDFMCLGRRLRVVLPARSLQHRQARCCRRIARLEKQSVKGRCSACEEMERNMCRTNMP